MGLTNKLVRADPNEQKRRPVNPYLHREMQAPGQ